MLPIPPSSASLHFLPASAHLVCRCPPPKKTTEGRLPMRPLPFTSWLCLPCDFAFGLLTEAVFTSMFPSLSMPILKTFNGLAYVQWSSLCVCLPCVSVCVWFLLWVRFMTYFETIGPYFCVILIFSVWSILSFYIFAGHLILLLICTLQRYQQCTIPYFPPSLQWVGQGEVMGTGESTQQLSFRQCMCVGVQQ